MKLTEPASMDAMAQADLNAASGVSAGELVEAAIEQQTSANSRSA
jgi:hypothetical protein